MLYLLRKIRRKLLTNNRVGTYLLYALGEIMLVVTGILIAVNIDDWNEQRKLISQEENYLKRLVAENKQDIESFSALIDEVEISMQSIEAFCEALNDVTTSDSLLLHTAEQYMIYGSVVPIFNSSRSTFDDLSSTGNLKVIMDVSLRDLVVQHYAEIQQVQERMKINSDWALAFDMPFFYETHGMKFVPSTAHLFPKQSQRDLANELRKNSLAYINNTAGGYWADQDAKEQLEKLQDKTIHLINHMEKGTYTKQNSLPDPLAAGWQGESVCKLLQENAHLRILKCSFPPGVGHERHFHGPHVGYTLAGSLMRMKDTTGTREVQTIAGTSFSSSGIQWHEVLNIGTDTAEYLIIEYK